MIYLKDVWTKEIFEFKTLEESINFTESYIAPNNLVGIKIYYSDGSGWNGESSGVAYGEEGAIIISIDKINRTNNETEYEALIMAMEHAEKYDHIRVDSQLVKNQTELVWRCNLEHLRILRDKARTLMLSKEITIEWVRREKNLAGIQLEKVIKGGRSKNA